MSNKMDEFIEDLKCLLEESNEDGNLETRFRVAELLDNQLCLINSNKKVEFLECSVCNGEGKFFDYDDTWDCSACLKLGGKWVIANE